MNQYIIYCTEEQTKKALELGAPLQRYTSIPNFADVIEITTYEYYEIPTAEQMIGWLEKQNLIYTIHIYKTTFTWRFDVDTHTIGTKNGLALTRKEATIAAIDAALDYLNLINKKK